MSKVLIKSWPLFLETSVTPLGSFSALTLLDSVCISLFVFQSKVKAGRTKGPGMIMVSFGKLAIGFSHRWAKGVQWIDYRDYIQMKEAEA